MLADWTGRGLGAVLTITVVWCGSVDQAGARPRVAYGVHAAHGARYASSVRSGIRYGYGRYARHHYTSLRRWASSGLQCVPFARENTGIELSGNAGTWWEKADGLYERGARPEVGSILNFRATGHMRMGHVAVVTNVLDSRRIEIDHANWASPGRISRDIDVVDVSPANDWTAVRVELDHTSEFGSVYPTYGFIYDRPDHGTMLANTGIAPNAFPLLDAAPADLRPAADRVAAAVLATAPEEVAEASDEADDMGTTHRWTRHSYRHGRFGRHAQGAWVAAHGKSHRMTAQFSPHAAVYRVSSHAPASGRRHQRHF